MAWAMSNLGSALTTLGNYTNALDFLYKSLNMFNELKDTQGLMFVYGDLGLCYREQGDYKQAIQNIEEALRLFNSIHQTVNYKLAGMLASVFERNNQLDSALFYGEQAYKVLNDWSGLLTVLGAIHAKLGHNQLALEFYKRDIPSAIRNNDQIDMLDAYNGMANVYWHEGKTDSAIFFAKQALNQQWGRAYPIGMLKASSLLADIYQSKNINDSTLKYLKLTINLKDSLFNQQKTREAQGFAFNEQLHQQELKQKLEQENAQYRSRLNIYLLLGGLLILSILAVGLWRRNIFKQKSFALLQKQKEQIQDALTQLKSTQSQLIQSEKMASLGELTAGIAHEIQNPLNFVNNFSEVNKELLVEMKEEMDKGNINDAKVLADDVIANQEKINHHGKRADAIVKGMLQHSRSSTGKKEPTNINALADEYLRLSYHGLKAKEKEFNARMNTDFDQTIGTIDIIPQDIGRVLLNLYNNAFYAVIEKAKLSANSYQPTVEVKTRRINDKIEIIVSDNGNGIPQKIVDKIFQPFFTTKPTGQGTGLGLSLSYDIVKAHSGEIRVETKEGKGSEFIIQLPFV